MRTLCAALLALALLGCSGGTALTTAPPDAATVAPPRTYDYALTSLTIDESDDPSLPHTGFNLDVRYSTQPLQAADCGHSDFFSALDPDQNENDCTGTFRACKGGVDNQLPAMFNRHPPDNSRAWLQAEVHKGQFTLLLRVEGVESLNDDADVTVVIAVGHPMFSSCTHVGTPDQPYAIDASSLRDGAPLARYPAAIVRGRLALQVPASTALFFDLFQATEPFSELGRFFLPPLRAVQLRVTLRPLEGSNGNLGGRVSRYDYQFHHNPFGMKGLERGINALLDEVVDLQFEGSCDAPNSAVGFGFGFRLTRARIAPTPVTGPLDGMCGTARMP